ncbi:AIPR family protein [Thermoleptolyngbya sp.]
MEFEFSLPTEEYRSLPVPFGDSAIRKLQLATFFVPVEALPDQLRDWMEVNPRIPRFNKKDQLSGVVAKEIVRTLKEDPEKFGLKNQGIYVIAQDVEFKKEAGGQGRVYIKLTDPKKHGVVNGGHTFRAIREVAQDEDRPDPWTAYVRMHIFKADEPDAALIAEMAEGLNRSLQVDDPSLENLRGSFDKIKAQLSGKRGEEQIAYRQGDPGDIDVQQVITYMSMLNLNAFPDRRRHPHTLFGQPKAVLQSFIEEINKENSAFDLILPRLHEILVLTDRIQIFTAPSFGKIKISNAKKNNRVGSATKKKIPAHFAGGYIGGDVPLGFLYPMLAAFRANISYSAWQQGKFEWLTNPDDLLKAVHEEMAQIIKQEYEDNKGKPAEVGRKEAAYRGCYTAVTLELAHKGALQPTEM